MTDVTTVHRLLHRHRLLRVVGSSGAHSLRNVAQTLQMSVDLLRGVPDAEVSIPELVDEASFRLLTLADRLGQWSSNKPRASQPVALKQMLAPLPDLLHNHPARDSLAFDMQVADDFPLVNVIADDLIEVAWELVTNALQARKPGTKATVRIVATIADGRGELAVVDDGPGVAAEMMSSLFSVIDRDAGEAPGLGLAVSRQLMRDVGGDLLFRPANGGATFVCIVPLWRNG
ncbi:MAG: ATP-binding protein [Gemmatimonadota bacterium]